MQNAETGFNLIEHSPKGFKSGSSNADINKPKAKPWAFGKTFNPLLKGSGDKRQSFNAFRYGR